MLNMSEIATESALAALLRPLREMKDDFGFSVHTAMQNDVNGAGWCLVDYFSDSGIRYLTMGINKTRSILPFDKPTTFWWESPSGKRVLAYRADHYHLGNMWKIHEGNLESSDPIWTSTCARWSNADTPLTASACSSRVITRITPRPRSSSATW